MTPQYNISFECCKWALHENSNNWRNHRYEIEIEQEWIPQHSSFECCGWACQENSYNKENHRFEIEINQAYIITILNAMDQFDEKIKIISTCIDI
jgi:hypothetical protein